MRPCREYATWEQRQGQQGQALPQEEEEQASSKMQSGRQGGLEVEFGVVADRMELQDAERQTRWMLM